MIFPLSVQQRGVDLVVKLLFEDFSKIKKLVLVRFFQWLSKTHSPQIIFDDLSPLYRVERGDLVVKLLFENFSKIKKLVLVRFFQWLSKTHSPLIIFDDPSPLYRVERGDFRKKVGVSRKVGVSQKAGVSQKIGVNQCIVPKNDSHINLKIPFILLPKDFSGMRIKKADRLDQLFCIG